MYPEPRFSHNWLIKKAVNDQVRRCAAVWDGIVLDLGCGVRPFQQEIMARATFCIGVEWANTLHDSKPDVVADINRPLPFADASVDHVVSFEVIEHLDAPRLASLERAVFEFAAPATVIVTTPNREYNALFETLPAGAFRHSDHRFEWTRAEFETWAREVADRHGYAVRFAPIGPVSEQFGAPSQMAVFSR